MSELSYLAGLVDGEGSVGWHSCGKGRKRFVIEIKMTSEVVIDWIVERYGGYKQYRPLSHEKRKDQWRWRVQGPAAVDLYKRLKPLLLLK